MRTKSFNDYTVEELFDKFERFDLGLEEPDEEFRKIIQMFEDTLKLNQKEGTILC